MNLLSKLTNQAVASGILIPQNQISAICNFEKTVDDKKFDRFPHPRTTDFISWETRKNISYLWSRWNLFNYLATSTKFVINITK